MKIAIDQKVILRKQAADVYEAKSRRSEMVKHDEKRARALNHSEKILKQKIMKADLKAESQRLNQIHKENEIDQKMGFLRMKLSLNLI